MRGAARERLAVDHVRPLATADDQRCIGKAGRQMKTGAAIGQYGIEHLAAGDAIGVPIVLSEDIHTGGGRALGSRSLENDVAPARDGKASRQRIAADAIDDVDVAAHATMIDIGDDREPVVAGVLAQRAVEGEFA